MKLPKIRGLIDRRILVNYRVDPAVLSKLLPEPFRPKIVSGVGIAGICLIRLKDIRPSGFPAAFGVTSENAAHRIAVEWDENGIVREGVYIPRRDTSSRFNMLFGGRVFPVVNHFAQFQVSESEDRFQIVVDSDDRETHVAVDVQLAQELPSTSIFESLEMASHFFEQGAVGYSPAAGSSELHGVELRSFNWKIEPLAMKKVESSFFEDTTIFPLGSTELDCALLMRGINHEWYARESLCAA